MGSCSLLGRLSHYFCNFVACVLGGKLRFGIVRYLFALVVGYLFVLILRYLLFCLESWVACLMCSCWFFFGFCIEFSRLYLIITSPNLKAYSFCRLLLQLETSWLIDWV